MADTTPTLAGFLLFIRNSMQITAAVLPDSSPSIPDSYNVAIELVNSAISQASPLMYTYAVYNLGGSNIVNYAQDQDGQSYFKALRKDLNILGLVPGLIESTNDNGTGSSRAVPEALKRLTLADLQYVKDPWGRQYVAIAQKYGTIWGLT